MIPTRDDLELYVTGNYDGDVAALEQAITDDAAAGQFVAAEARLELLLRDAAAAATFCAGCDDLVRAERCESCGAAVRPGGYTVERVLVNSAHGRMYLARDADGKQVALKELAFVHSPSLAALAAFEREAKFLRALEHPAIPRFCACFEEGHGVHTRYYLAQEFIVGTALDARLNDHWYSEAEILEVARQVLEVLVYLQDLSPMVIHRDIKPANLLSRADTSIALVDFGAAHVQGTTAGSTSIGTFGYMPLEQLAGQVDATTDLFALGSTLVHLLTRREPWRMLHVSNLDGTNVSAPLRAFLAKLVAGEPRDRFQSAKLALAALADVRDGRAVAPAPASASTRLRGARRWMPMFAAAAALVVGSAGYGVWHELGGSKDHPASGDVRLSTGAGELRGVVRNPAGKPLAGAKIMASPGNTQAVADADGKFQLDLPAGRYKVDVSAPGLRTWDVDLKLDANSVVLENVDMVDEAAAARPSAPHAVPASLPHLGPIDLAVKKAALRDVLHHIGEACGLSFVVPSGIEVAIDANLAKVPCDQALEVLLEAHGLWYEFYADGNLVRIVTRKDLDTEVEATAYRVKVGSVDDALPAGPPVDLDLKDAPLRDVFAVLARLDGVNVFIPNDIQVNVTVSLKHVPWQRAVQTILAANGLWYRYRENGKVIRVATRKDLDTEDESARYRAKMQ